MPFDIPNSWTPTAQNINALPAPLRRYIHDLQANVDPTGVMRENFRLWQEIATLRKQLTINVSGQEPAPASDNDLDVFYFSPRGN